MTDPFEPPGRRARTKEQEQFREAIHAFLKTTADLSQGGKSIEAEARMKQTLAMAEREFGRNSDEVMLVLSCLSALYRAQNRRVEANILEGRIRLWYEEASKQAEEDEPLEPYEEPESGLAQKFKRNPDAAKKPAVTNHPADIRRACKIMGLPSDKQLSTDLVNKAWKKQMLQSSAHPDLGGNAEEAIMLNQAKEQLLDYVSSITPNLGARLKKREDS
jgi:hypothetical protein